MSADDSRAGLVVLAVDDERPALELLRYSLQQQAHVAELYTASDATDALRVLRGGDEPGRNPIDVVFLDIGMPGLDGLELARLFATLANPPAVVFVTGYGDRAVEAYDVGAVDYLMKPINNERLAESLRRVMRTRLAASAPEDNSGTEDEVIPVELAGTTKLVPRSTVRFVEAQGDYARLHTADGSHLVRIPLSVLEDKWADAGFVRIHRSFLVALPLVTELRMAASGYVVRIGGAAEPAELPVSRRHTRELKDRLVRAAKQAWNQR
ncbi:MAG TPA: LytTR family DNA-binding domain-containing protein [Pseudonocardiaceae bacterium]